MSRKGRNPNGEGSRKVMSDGRVTYKVMVGKSSDGKPIYLQVYQRKGETIANLKKRFEDEKKKFAAIGSLSTKSTHMVDIIKEGADTSVKSFLIQFIEDYKKPVVKPSTYCYYTNILYSNILPMLGEYKLCEIKPIVLQNYIKLLCDSGLSYRTVKGALQLLKAGFDEAVHNELLVKNPAANVKIPKKPQKKDVVVFTRDEQNTFMNAIKGLTHELFFTMALSTGMRCGEILGLQWKNVDFNTNTINICDNLTIVYDVNSGSSVHLGTPKSSAGIRKIPISAHLAELLKQHQQEHMLLFGEVDGFVFKTNQNQPYHSRSTFAKALKKICSDNNLPILNLHALRHCFATRGLEAGVMPRVMQNLLGHEDFTLFTQTYSHVLDELYSKESEKLLDAIEEITGSAL